MAPGPNVRRRYRVDKGSCGAGPDTAPAARLTSALAIAQSQAVDKLRLQRSHDRSARLDLTLSPARRGRRVAYIAHALQTTVNSTAARVEYGCVSH